MRKKIFSVLLSSVLLLSSAVSAFAVDTENSNGTGYAVDPYDRLSETIYDMLGWSSYYDPRTDNRVTEVENQGSSDLCWMYSAIAMAEQSVSEMYGTNIDISEHHGAVALSNLINKNSVNNGFMKNDVNSTGNFSKAAQYLTNWNSSIFADENYTWNSMVLNEDFENTATDEAFDIDESNFSSAQSVYNITDVRYVWNNTVEIERIVDDFGAVTCSMYIDEENFSVDDNGDATYLSDCAVSNHEVTIVGWDDFYSKENFKGENKPAYDGAWLVKNSWGTGDFKQDGYMWVSYAEPSINNENNKIAAITGVQANSDSDYMLSYDYFPINGGTESYSDTVYMANVFDMSEYADVYESINKVMFYFKVLDCTYNIRIAKLEDDTMPSDIDSLEVLATGQENGEGYKTVELNSNYPIESDGKYAVIVEFVPNNEDSAIYIPAEEKQPSSVQSGQSWFCINNSDEIVWCDCNEISAKNMGNICIRPVLYDEDEKSHYAKLSTNQIIDTSTDAEITIDSDCELFSIKYNSGVLNEGTDYVRNGNTVVLKSSFMQYLNDRCTEIDFVFTNDVTETLVVNPRATIESVTVDGETYVGETLTANLITDIEKEDYDVTYQWQASLWGQNWYDIAYANSKEYTLTENDMNLYIRVVVTSKNYGNIVYPLSVASEKTDNKVAMLGDVNSDYIVNIADATLIQKYSADLTRFSDEQLRVADVNKDGVINVSDATLIQKMCVQ